MEVNNLYIHNLFLLTALNIMSFSNIELQGINNKRVAQLRLSRSIGGILFVF